MQEFGLLKKKIWAPENNDLTAYYSATSSDFHPELLLEYVEGQWPHW